MENNVNTKRPLICLFDSGIGGLNLLKECVLKMPQARFCYFADNYNVPYGNLSEAELQSLVSGIFEKIAALKPDAAAVACNTVTAQCIAGLRQKYSFPIVGVQPAVKQAHLHGGMFLVPVTRATNNSYAFKKLLSQYGQKAVVCPCDNLAKEIEDNIFSLPADALAQSLPQGNFSSVVLGCTHYIFIKEAFSKRYNCPVFDGMEQTADHLSKILGIDDHKTVNNPEIAFLGGNSPKNRQIFEKLCKF